MTLNYIIALYLLGSVLMFFFINPSYKGEKYNSSFYFMVLGSWIGWVVLVLAYLRFKR